MQIESIKNPLFELTMYMQTYEKNGLDDPKFQRRCKNLHTNFNKLYLSIDSIINHKESGLDLSKNELYRVQVIEYCFLKISTIWDLTYQIGSYNLSYGRGNKYEKLEVEFESYKKNLDFLTLSWYQDINKIRNRVVHGGVSIVPFYDEGTLYFNAYDQNVESIIPHCSIFTRSNGRMADAVKYFMYYAGILYKYICDFFIYVLKETKKKSKSTIELGQLELSFLNNSKDWCFSNLESYNKYAIETHNLPLTIERNDYLTSRLSVHRFNYEAGSVRFKSNMVSSICQKYGLDNEWVDKSTLKIAVNDRALKYYPKMIDEIARGDFDLRISSPNIREGFWLMKFNFRSSCYELYSGAINL